MARTAKAAVYEAPNTPFIIKTYPLRPAKPGEVLVKVTMSTICRSDIHSYEGRRPNPCPGILGHEIIGVIEEIGAGIEKDMRGDPLKVRDRITWSEYCACRSARATCSSIPPTSLLATAIALEPLGQALALHSLTLRHAERTVFASRRTWQLLVASMVDQMPHYSSRKSNA